MASMFSLGASNVSMLLGSTSSSYGMNSIYDSIGTYNSIRSGSYGKLLRTYYKEVQPYKETDKTSSNKKNSDKVESQAKVLAKVKTKTDQLASTATELATTGSKSLFKADDKSTDKAVEKAQEFVKDYNETIKALKSSTDTSTNKRAASMVENTENYERQLSRVGITIKDDNTLSVDSDQLKSASYDDLKRVFNGSGSFASTTAQKASMVGGQAAIAATRPSTYTSHAAYSSTNLDNLFDGMI